MARPAVAGRTVRTSPVTGSVREKILSAPGSKVVNEARLGSSWLRAKPMAMGEAEISGAITTFKSAPSPRATICAGCLSAMRRIETPGLEDASSPAAKDESAA